MNRMHQRKQIRTIARNLGYPIDDAMRIVGVNRPTDTVLVLPAIRALNAAWHDGRISRTDSQLWNKREESTP